MKGCECRVGMGVTMTMVEKKAKWKRDDERSYLFPLIRC